MNASGLSLSKPRCDSACSRGTYLASTVQTGVIQEDRVIEGTRERDMEAPAPDDLFEFDR